VEDPAAVFHRRDILNLTVTGRFPLRVQEAGRSEKSEQGSEIVPPFVGVKIVA